MVSVIRLLQRQRIERHTTPYGFLLARILRSRFGQSIRLLLILAVLLAAVAWTVQGMRLVGALVALATSVVASLIMQKVLTTVTYVPKPSLAREAVARLCSVSLALVVAIHAFSAVLWFNLAILPTWSNSNLVTKKTYADSASQIPAGLPKHFGHKHTPHVEWIVNERFVYACGYGLFSAVVFGLNYSIRDRRRLVFEVSELGQPAFKRIKQRIQPALDNVGRVVLASTVGWLILYPVLNPAGRVGAWYAGWNVRQGSSASTSGFPGLYLSLVVCPFQFTMVLVLWEVTVQVYHAYMTLGPGHRGGHTVSDPSPDPNGSLVSGLTSKNMSLLKLTAWYELAVIAAHHPARRVAIFADSDSDRTIWQQIFAAWLSLSADAVTKLRQPELALKAAEKKAREKALVDAQKTLHLEPIVVQKTLLEGGSRTSTLRPASGSSSSVKETVLPPSQKLYLRDGEPSKRAWYRRLIDRLIQGDSQAPWVKRIVSRISALHRDFTAWIHSQTLAFLRLDIGEPFRQTTARRLGELLPEPDHQILVFALRGMSEMIVKSYDEDEIGYVQSTIGQYLTSINEILVQLEQLIGHPPVHWTDARVAEGLDKPDVSVATSMHAEASAAFASVTDLFSPYFSNLKVSAAVVERSKKFTSL